MADLTNYSKDLLSNALLRGQGFTPPATVYLALYVDATNDGGGGTEVSGGSYARQPLTLSDPSGGGSMTNVGDIVFPSMPQVDITNGAILDDSVAGNMLMHSAFDSAKTVNAGDAFTIPAGSLNTLFA